MEKPNRGCVYLLTEPKDKEKIRYVGITVNAPRRYRRHIFEGRHGKNLNHKICWIRGLLNKGMKPNMILLEFNDDVEWLKKREIELISHYKSLGCNLTNTTIGGEGGFGRKCSEKQKRRYRKIFSGKGNPFYGRSHSQETIQFYRDSFIGKKQNKTHSSNFVGVYITYDKRNKNNVIKRIRAVIRFNGKNIDIGMFKTELEAAKAYDKRFFKLYGKKPNSSGGLYD